MTSAHTYPVEELFRCYSQVFEALGVPPEDASVVSDTLRYADLRGIDTHGAARLPVYAARIEGGGSEPVTRLEVLNDDAAVVGFDANNGLGQVAASAAMQAAIQRADEFGIGLATVRRSNHLGTLGYYAEMALPERIGFALSGVASTLVAPGGGQAVLGSNPWAVALPGQGPFPLVVDMAMGETISPHLMRAAAQGLPIEEGLAVDSRGRPTTDPGEALAGGILPIGGYKGFALTLVLEILASVLPGAAFSKHIPTYSEGKTTPKRLGHSFIVIRIDHVRPLADFSADVAALLDIVRDSVQGDTDARIPGERKYVTMQRRAEAGVPVTAEVVAAIDELTSRLGVDPPQAI